MKANSGVLVLNTQGASYSPKPSIIISLEGEKLKESEFEYDNQTEVSHSCALVWRNENFIIGGWQTQNNERRQVSKIENCRLTRVGNLEFDHRWGTCANINDEKVYLCFNRKYPGYDDDYVCRFASSPTGLYQEAERSTYRHRLTNIGTYQGLLKK